MLPISALSVIFAVLQKSCIFSNQVRLFFVFIVHILNGIDFSKCMLFTFSLANKHTKFIVAVFSQKVKISHICKIKSAGKNLTVRYSFYINLYIHVSRHIFNSKHSVVFTAYPETTVFIMG